MNSNWFYHSCGGDIETFYAHTNTTEGQYPKWIRGNVKSMAFYAVYVLKNMLDVWAQDAICSGIEPILFERAKSDPDYYAWIMHTITGGELKVEQSYLDKVYSQENLAAGRFSKAKLLTPEAHWASWEDWKKALVTAIFKTYGLHKLYTSVGYDVSFIK